MSTRGVRQRLVQTLLQHHGRLTETELQAIVAYAHAGALTVGERRALMQVPTLVASSADLRRAGLTPARVQVEPGAWALLGQLGRQWQMQPQLGAMQLVADEGARPAAEEEAATTAGADQPAGAGAGDEGAGDESAEQEAALAAALERGEELGDHAEWRVSTPGADLRFHVEVFGQAYPALVLEKPVVADPGRRDLVAEHAAQLADLPDLAALGEAARAIAAEERAYLDAEERREEGPNRVYAVQSLRRAALLLGLRDLAMARPALGMGVNLLLAELRDDLLSGRDYEMQVGSHTNYWPYWDNFLDVVEKLHQQLDPASPGARAIRNRIDDILRRKTVFGYSRAIDEKDAERSLGAVLCWRAPFSEGLGHRVSLAPGSAPQAPRYELLALPAEELPAGWQGRAGAPVWRDEDGTLRLERTGAGPAGEPVPPDLAARARARSVPPRELALRRPVPGERLRAGVAFDWNQDGGIAVAPIEIGWWGHCHNEAPANAMGVDPRKGVSWYSADRAVTAEAARVELSEEDCWDLVGAFTADHEGERVRDPRTGAVSQPGYVLFSSAQGYQPTRVDRTVFVGNRNNGGHWFQVLPQHEGARRVRVQAEVIDVWGLEDPTVRYDPPLSRFRRDLENDDGTFDPNPDWVESGMSDDDMIAVDCAGRRLTLMSRYISFDSAGHRVERRQRVELDPRRDAHVHLADEIEHQDPAGGGRLVEHWYNAATRSYRAVEVKVEVTGEAGQGHARRETGRQDWPAEQVVAVQETTYDSVAEIDEFIVDDMGLPLTFDTSAGQAVWNYPVQSIRRDVVRRVARDEGGQTFTYTTFRLRYTTMGGPSGDVRYISKRDALGRTVRALALDPMPDFAYRNERWVCAPVALDLSGQAAINLRAFSAGYGTDPARRGIVADLWERQAIALYASLTDRTAADRAYLFETQDGRLLSFPDQASFEAAVSADLRLRQCGR